MFVRHCESFGSWLRRHDTKVHDRRGRESIEANQGVDVLDTLERCRPSSPCLRWIWCLVTYNRLRGWFAAVKTRSGVITPQLVRADMVPLVADKVISPAHFLSSAYLDRWRNLNGLLMHVSNFHCILKGDFVNPGELASRTSHGSWHRR